MYLSLLLFNVFIVIQSKNERRNSKRFTNAQKYLEKREITVSNECPSTTARVSRHTEASVCFGQVREWREAGSCGGGKVRVSERPERRTE